MSAKLPQKEPRTFLVNLNTGGFSILNFGFYLIWIFSLFSCNLLRRVILGFIEL